MAKTAGVFSLAGLVAVAGQGGEHGEQLERRDWFGDVVVEAGDQGRHQHRRIALVRLTRQ